MCTRYRRSWMAFNKGFSSSRCTQRPRRPPTQNDAQPTRPHDKRHLSQMLYGCFLFLLYQQHTWSLNTSCTFCPPFFFLRVASSSGQFVISVVYCLYFFCHARGLSRCIHHYHPSFHPFCPFYALYLHDFCTHLTLGLPFIPHAPTSGYPGMTDTYDACTPSQRHPSSFH
jgi:hypothetical protein